MSTKTVSTEVITHKIFFIRGQKVMLDKNFSQLYRVKPIRLREQVKRNRRRFPEDFMLQLTHEEVDSMVSQNAIPSRKYLGGYRPYVFTEQGVAMLSTVLNSERAIFVNIAIMRAFVKMREALSLHKELAAKFKELEHKVEGHDKDIRAVFEAIRRLMREEEKPKREIGFHA